MRSLETPTTAAPGAFNAPNTAQPRPPSSPSSRRSRGRCCYPPAGAEDKGGGGADDDDDVNNAATGRFSGAPKPLQLGLLTGHRGPVLGVAFSADGNYCLSASQDGTVRLWNPLRRLLIREYAGPHNYEVNGVTPTRDNSRFVSVGGDKIAFLWDVATGRVLRKFIGHDGKLLCCCFNGPENDSGGNVLCTGSLDHTVCLWDMRKSSRGPIQQLREAKDSVTCIAVDGASLMSGSLDGQVRSYDLRKGQLSSGDLGAGVSSVSLSSDGGYLVVGCLDSSICLLDRQTDDVLGEYRGHTNRSFRVRSCLDPTDSFVFGGSEDHRICMWDLLESADHRPAASSASDLASGLRRSSMAMSLAVHKGPVLDVQFSVERFDLPLGRTAGRTMSEGQKGFPEHDDGGPACRDGAYLLLTASVDNSVCVWKWSGVGGEEELCNHDLLPEVDLLAIKRPRFR